jgi:outer membrane receptor protein involved in Fe transport
MKRVLTLLLTITTLSFGQSAGQSFGEIHGKLTDHHTGEQIIGANVVLVGTTMGAMTDFSGSFQIKNVPEGSYSVRFSFVGYSAKLVRDVIVKVGTPTRLDVVLRPEVIEGEEVIVEAEVIRNTEAALLQQQRKAPTIRDGISEEQIKRTPDATSGELLRRVTGVSLVDNKFVYVRGTGARYSNALLNGVRLSSTEPDKRSFAFDLIPASFMENVIVTKTFTPDLPGDFSGGLVQLNTVDFPHQSTMRLSSGSSWNTRSTYEEFRSYDGGKTDWLGYDNSHRTLPSGFPETFSGMSQAEKNNWAKSLKNLWSTYPRRAPMNQNYQLSYGNSNAVFDNSFGYVAAMTYRNGFSRTEAERADYDDAGLRYRRKGEIFRSSNVWGSILNFSYGIGSEHKLSSKSTYTQIGEDEIVHLEGFNNLQSNDEILTSMQYVSRSVLSSQVEGEHSFPSIGNAALQWRGSYSAATRNEPDLRKMIYARSTELPDSKYEAQIPYNASSTGSSTRFFSYLKDFNRGFDASISLPVWAGKVKFGGLVNGSRRDFRARNFVYTMPRYNANLTTASIDTLFTEGNIGGARGLQFDEYQDRRNRYNAGQDLYATFAMIDMPVSLVGTDWRFIGGFRVEHSEQALHSGNLQNEDVDVAYKAVDVLPSINATYIIDNVMNLRLAYSRTINRPEFREFAPFAFYDISTELTTYGNPNLKRALVRNYDIRWEMFPGIGEIVSVSYFHKEITDAIEQVVVSTVALAGERTFDNAPTASNYGFELEMRKTLDFVGRYFANFSVSANYTRVYSRVRLGDRARSLQGQSPYTINLGAHFTEPTLGTSFSVMYNKFGERISEVATVYTLDVMEQPRDVVDVTLSQSIFETFELKFAGKDILQREQVFMQGKERVRVNKFGSTYSVGLSVKL